MVVSDHGQGRLRAADEAFVLADHVDLGGLTIRDHATFVSLYLDEYDEARACGMRDAINANWTHGRAYLRRDSPAHWRVPDERRFADIVAIADPSYGVISRRKEAWRLKPGAHGWDPTYDDMRGVLLAAGPRLPAGRKRNHRPTCGR